MILRYLCYLFSGIGRLFSSLLGTLLTLSVVIILGIIIGYYYILNDLPDVSKLKSVQLQAPLRVLSSDGQLIAEFGTKKRIPVTYDEIPKLLVEAIIATEDQRFFQHGGVDPLGILRAAKSLVFTGKRTQGGSTVTMQVARNFFLTRERTYTRKLREVVLATKINQELSKEKIMELYLNKIYLGNRAYGVASAAQTYYGKTLDELTLAQIAMLAGLPKGPSILNPLANPTAAKKRRQHVLNRMLDQNYISKAEYDSANAAPLTASYHGLKIELKAPYVAEMVRSALTAEMGEDAYTKGYSVYTTVDATQQRAANKAVRDALLGYTKRHGYRGSAKNMGGFSKIKQAEWQDTLKKMPTVNGLHAAIVTKVQGKDAEALLSSGEIIPIKWSGLSWARPYTGRRWPGRKPRRAGDIITVGDVIHVTKGKKDAWQLSQIPKASAALVALDPENGALTAVVGGFDFHHSKFNRALQAERQPGSSFKPFIYSAALSKGYTLATTINDAPIVISNPGETDFWRPQNNSRRFYGPTRLRLGLTKSRNLVTIRLLEAIGIPYAVDYLEKFGFESNKLPHALSLALGTGVVTPLQMATGFAVFANGGYKLTPYFIERIEDIDDNIIVQSNPPLACNTIDAVDTCATDPAYKDKALAPQVITPQTAYLMTSALQSVVKQGTGRAALKLKRTDLSGKTGTTNDQIDAWFVGYNRDIVTSVWVGFDQPRSLFEYGSQAALPLWIDFMGQALKGKPENSQALPPGIVSVRIDKDTGFRTSSVDNSMFEIFREANVPDEDNDVIYPHSADDSDNEGPLF